MSNANDDSANAGRETASAVATVDAAAGKLPLYEQVRTATDELVIAFREARTVDEVKDLNERLDALRALARLINDLELELHIAELKERGVRRIGEMMKLQKDTVGMNLAAGRKRKLHRTAMRLHLLR